MLLLLLLSWLKARVFYSVVDGFDVAVVVLFRRFDARQKFI